MTRSSADVGPQDIPGERPASHHGVALAASSMPIRHSSSRNHAHSVSLGAYNPDHRVTRRKSVNNHSVSHSGVFRGALNGGDDSDARSSHRRSMPTKSGPASRVPDVLSDGKIAASHGQPAGKDDDFAIADEAGPVQHAAASAKARARRASEGSQLSGKRVSREVKCEKCGKGYKHSSCLTKHLLVLSLHLSPFEPSPKTEGGVAESSPWSAFFPSMANLETSR